MMLVHGPHFGQKVSQDMGHKWCVGEPPIGEEKGTFCACFCLKKIIMQIIFTRISLFVVSEQVMFSLGLLCLSSRLNSYFSLLEYFSPCSNFLYQPLLQYFPPCIVIITDFSHRLQLLEVKALQFIFGSQHLVPGCRVRVQQSYC